MGRNCCIVMTQIIVHFCILVAALLDTSEASCDRKYESYTSDHVMCIPEDDIFLARLNSIQKDRELAKNMLIVVNKLRSIEMHKGNARAMLRLHWNNVLAEMAERWAATCPNSTIEDRRNYIPGQGGVNQVYKAVGQEHAADALAFLAKIKDNETEQLKSSRICDNCAPASEESPIKWIFNSKATHIGCAIGRGCTEGGIIFVCNIAPSRFVMYQKRQNPDDMKEGCADHFNVNLQLCDCGGKSCYNGVLLDTDTCQCRKCSSSRYGYNLNDDEKCTLNCDASETGCEGYTRCDEKPIMCPKTCKLCLPEEKPKPSSPTPTSTGSTDHKDPHVAFQLVNKKVAAEGPLLIPQTARSSGSKICSLKKRCCLLKKKLKNKFRWVANYICRWRNLKC